MTVNSTLPGSRTGTPARRTNSVRRTATIDMTWPEGIGTPLHLVGRARDLVTPADGDPFVAGDASVHVTIAQDRTIATITAEPERPGIAGLVGAQGGSYMRAAIDAALPGSARPRLPCTSSLTTSPARA